jgi:hypothetical protein
MKFEVFKTGGKNPTYEIRKDGFPIGLETDKYKAIAFCEKKAQEERDKKTLIYTIEV